MFNSALKTVSATMVALAISTGATYAQSVSSGDVVNALKLKDPSRPATRSFGAPKNGGNSKVSSQDRSFISNLSSTRAIKVEQRDKLIAIVEKSELPSINIRILFGYDSDQIDSRSFADLDEIGKALLDQSLENSKIMLNGHTDASGTRFYNQNLSERRAVSVKRYLTQRLHVPAGRLVVAGFGEDRLRFADDPENGKNRRVEIINLGK